jgi:hypothetical protein
MKSGSNRSAAAKKAAATRKHRAAGIKAAGTRKANIAAKKRSGAAKRLTIPGSVMQRQRSEATLQGKQTKLANATQPQRRQLRTKRKQQPRLPT